MYEEILGCGEPECELCYPKTIVVDEMIQITKVKVNPYDMMVSIQTQEKETEKKMYLDTKADFGIQQKQYLLDRVSRAFANKAAQIEIKFGMRGEKAPKNIVEFIDRIKSGKIVIKEGCEKKPLGYYMDAITSCIEFRDPSIKKDEDGCEKAYEVLSADRTKVEDKIMIASAEDALKAVEAFEAKN